MSKALIVHIGAGCHLHEKDVKYKKLISKALQSNNFVEAGKVLESSRLTNTGYGSSLDIQGEVRCDASYIVRDERNLEGGSMYNIDARYPISETMKCFAQLKVLYEERWQNLGLSIPRVIDYKQKDFVASLCGCEVEMPEKKSLISPRAKLIYDSYRPRLGDISIPSKSDIDGVSDTIGLIEIEQDITKLASSSGGNFFKLPGRIGCAGILGGAIACRETEELRVSCTCSGNGDEIILLMLADAVCSALLNCTEPYDYAGFLVSKLKEGGSVLPESMSNSDRPLQFLYVGAICLIQHKLNDTLRLVYCHSTESFFFGFRIGDQKEIILSRLDNSSQARQTFVRGEYKLQ